MITIEISNAMGVILCIGVVLIAGMAVIALKMYKKYFDTVHEATVNNLQLMNTVVNAQRQTIERINKLTVSVEALRTKRETRH